MLIDVIAIDENTTQTQGLPPSVFKDQSLFQKEYENLFKPGWVSVASGQQIPNPGDVLPIQIGETPLLITRNSEGDISVFYNVCRHKGAPLIDGPCNKRTIVCPYHRWTFNLQGQLKGAPVLNGDKRSLDKEEKEQMGLIPIRFELWWDTIFVNLSGDAEPFSQFIKPLDDLLKDYGSNPLASISTTEYQSDSNWKLAVDNFLDGYHVPFVHSQAVTIPSVLGHEDLFLSDDIVGMKLANGAADKPAKTDKPLPHFSHLTQDNIGTQLWFGIFPNTLLFVDPVWVQMIIVRPESATFCRETLTLYAANPDTLNEQYTSQRAALSDALNEVNRQDIELLDKLQVTRSSEGAAFGRLSDVWDKVNVAFQQTWLKKMKNSTVSESK